MKKFIHFLSAAIVSIALCIGCGDDTTTDADITVDDDVTTKTSYTVTFDSNDGTSVATQTVDEDESATEPDAPTKAGYTFDAWYSDAALGAKYDFATTVTADITLYAKWSVEVYDVVFYYNDGEDSTYETTVEFGSSVVAPNAPSRMDYTFDGWYTAATGGEEYVFEAIDESAIPTGTIAIYAQWSEIPTVATVYFYSAISYDGSESAFDTQYLQPDASVPTITAPAIDYYTTDGKWYTDMACTEEYDQSTTYQEAAEMIEVKLYAKWTINTYTVTFSTDYGTAPDAITGVEHGSTVESLGTAPERTGYEFDGWCANASCTEKFTTETAVTGDITVYASWTPAIYDVVFYYNNGTDGKSETTVAFGSTIEAPESNPTNGDYTLIGWYTAAEDGTIYTFEAIDEAAIPADGTIEIYAQWAITTAVNFYSAANYDGSETIFETQYVIVGETAVSITPEEIEGYANDGKWYTDTACTTEYTFTETYQEGDAAVSLYAKWTINTYTITFSTDYGTAPDAITDVEHGSTVASLGTAPETDGYDLVGWYSDADFATEFVAGVTEVKDNLTLYAKWERGDIYVTFVYNDGDATADLKVAYSYNAWSGYGTALPVDDPAEYTDHTFIGWYADEEMTEIYDFETALTGSISIYAKWWDHNATSAEIWNVAELCIFRDLVNDGIAGATDVTLKADLDLSTVCGADIGNWLSIGLNPEATLAVGLTSAEDGLYEGTFDGENHTISNIYFSSTLVPSEYTYFGYQGGLFAQIGNGAVVKNVTIKDIYVKNNSNNNLGCGAIAACIGNGYATIENCTTEGGSILFSFQAGGILGNCGNLAGSNYVIIENCKNLGTIVTTSTYSGGIVGSLYSQSTDCPDSEITNCHNEGAITASTTACGGIVGGTGTKANLVILGCSNTGAISKKNNVGGIAGSVGLSGTGSCKIIACYNTGTATGTSANVGGIVANSGKAPLTITSCYNMGAISSTADAPLAGAIIGLCTEDYDPTLTANYFIAGTATNGNGQYSNDDGAESVADVAALSAVLSTMNAACSSSGYQFVAGTDYPVVEAI